MQLRFPAGVRVPACSLGFLLIPGVLLGGALSVSELNYSDPEGGDYDFIELVNTSATPVLLNGCRFTRGVTYTFTTTEPLAAQQRIVVVRDRAKFLARYGSGFRVAEGTFGGGFSADGEAVTIVDSAGAEVLDFTFGTSGPWPSRPNGLGSTLECIDPLGDLNDSENWRPSSEWLGSPGRPGAGPQRQVAINELLAHTDPPYEDAIELLNLTDDSIRLDGWFLSDARSNPAKYRIPNNTVLPPRGRWVVYEYQFGAESVPAGQTSFTLNSSVGDETVLMSADSSGRLLLWMDVVSFGATANGVSLGRYPEGTGPLTAQRRQTLGTDVTPSLPPSFITEFRTGAGAPNAGPLVGPVVVRRIQYHPAPGGDEFIELESTASVTVPLYDPDYPSNTWRIRGGADFNIPPGVSLDPSSRLLIVGIDPALFRTRHAIPAAIPILGPWTNSLADDGDRVALFKPDPPQLPPHPDAGLVPYILVEEVEYLPTAPWPVEAAGMGSALLRRDAAAFANEPSNWTSDSVAPLTPPEVTAELAGAVLQLRFDAQSGRSYRLQGRDTQPVAPWVDLGLIPVPPAGGPVTLEVTPVGNSRLLQVVGE